MGFIVWVFLISRSLTSHGAYAFGAVKLEVYLLKDSFLYLLKKAFILFDWKFKLFPLSIVRFFCHTLFALGFSVISSLTAAAQYISYLVRNEQECFAKLSLVFSLLADRFLPFKRFLQRMILSTLLVNLGLSSLFD